jgi:peptidyl-prolyl cis-trans isomerase SurA
VWESPDVLKRRVPRLLVFGFLMAVAVSGLTACRTSPNVAAYVGDAQVTVSELDSAVASRLADPAIAAYADGKQDEFTRRVLSLLLQEDVYTAAAQRYDVQVSDDDVRARISELLGADDPEAVYGQLAQQGIGREDVFENVRQQLVRREIARAEGKAAGLDDTALQARYQEVREGLGQVSLGYIAVPDQATADAVLAQLTAAPAAYAALAAQFAGPYTLPSVEARAPDQVPSVLAQGIAAAAPNTGFAVAVPETGGIIVTFVEGIVYPTFEEVRADLEKEAADQADKAGTSLVEDVRSDLGVTVNPRFGVLKDGQLVPGDGGVVDILGDDPPAGAAPAE